MKLILFVLAFCILVIMLACGGGSTTSNTNGIGGTGTGAGSSGAGSGGEGSTGAPSVSAPTPPAAPGVISWEPVSTPFSQVNFIDFASNGHWFLADGTQGFFRSSDGGSTWAQINSGVATNFGWTINVNPSDGSLIAGL